ncbi:MAG: RHS repeat-associated core domain-containing protein [Deltaproteobacteria bacterium]|nr:RHS repeat-associated core domain-containing protein [Deltaproteobacteria bacterium]
MIGAKRREHRDQQPGPNDPSPHGAPHPNDTNALINYKETYAYDAVGNITQTAHTATGNSWTRDYSYANDSNRLSQNQIGPTPRSYTHDAHGKMTAMPHLALMTWDERDRLRATSAGTSGQPVTYYVYDGSGRRVRKVTEDAGEVRTKERISVGDFEIYREYDNGDIELERESLHVMAPSTDSSPNERLALVETLTWEGGDAITDPASLIRFQYSDHLGSSCVETDDTGTVISYEEYFPFGGTSYHWGTASVAKRYRYTGKERDEETGLYYYGARYYAAWLGRWTAADPSGLNDGPNVYAYVRTNPVGNIDPTGGQSLATSFSQPIRTEEQATARIQQGEIIYGAGNEALQMAKEGMAQAIRNPHRAIADAAPMMNPAGAAYYSTKDAVRLYCAMKDPYTNAGGGSAGAKAALNENLNPMMPAVAETSAAIDAYQKGDIKATGGHILQAEVATFKAGFMAYGGLKLGEAAVGRISPKAGGVLRELRFWNTCRE